MSEGRAELDRDLEVQREVTRVALRGLDGFALAGSGAVREHGLIGRPTEDVDLFTDSLDVARFDVDAGRVVDRLRAVGYTVEPVQVMPRFARLSVTSSDGRHLEVDLGVDWRHDEPVRLDVGPVLSLADAVGNKVSALYSRAEARDYLDVDAIRASGRFSDAELVDAAAERDAGFDIDMFASQLAAAARLEPAQVARYGVDADELEAVKTRCTQWAAALRQPTAAGPEPEPSRGVDASLRASFPQPATEAARQQSTDSTVRRLRQSGTPDRGLER